jgi:colicin import membrane protein
MVWLGVSSAVVHGLVLAGVVSYAAKSRGPLLKGPVYTVSLMEVPRGPKAAAAGLAPPVRKTLTAPTRKTVEAPSERSLKLPSKEKLKKPPPVSKATRAKAPAPVKPKAAPKKKALVATARPGASVGGTVSLDAAAFPFTYYLRAVEQKISSTWEPVVQGIPGGERRQVVIGFRILKDGSVEKPVVEKSSGISFFDQSALRAVIRATPLPPLPEAFPEDSLGIHFGFQYQPEG